MDELADAMESHVRLEERKTAPEHPRIAATDPTRLRAASHAQTV